MRLLLLLVWLSAAAWAQLQEVSVVFITEPGDAEVYLLPSGLHLGRAGQSVALPMKPEGVSVVFRPPFASLPRGR